MSNFIINSYRYAAAPSNGLKTDLVEWWELQSDANASHNGNDGADTNVTFSSEAQFNGSSSRINFGDIDLATDGDYSINMRVKTSQSGSGVFIDKFTAGQPYPARIAQNSSSRFYAQTYDGSSADNASATVAYNDGTYRMVTLVRDNTGGTLYLYINGSGTVYSVSDTLAADLNNNQDWVMGATATLAAWFNGSIKYCGMWNKVLTTTDLDNLYNSGTPLTYADLD